MLERTSQALAAAMAAIGCAALLASPTLALAGEPGSVTVRVQGFEGRTLLAQTQVTTTTAPIAVPGGSCPGTSLGGALYDAVQGDWLIRAEHQGAEVDGLLGQNLPAIEEEGNYAYWEIFLDDEYAKLGACAQEVGPGADIVLVGQCYTEGPYCRAGHTEEPEHFLIATAPSARVVSVGEAVSETISSYNTRRSRADSSPPEGTTLGDGETSAAPNAQGVATLSFSQPGTYTLQAQAPDSAPSDPYEVCVRALDGEGCGALGSTPGGPGGGSGGAGGGVAGYTNTGSKQTGTTALLARILNPRSGHTYTRRRAPRTITGTVHAASAISSVRLSLRRSFRGRCYAYQAARERFTRARCGHAGGFHVPATASFSYLLPERLAPGRYVIELQVSDAAGQRSTPKLGVSEVVFHVA